MADLTGTVSDIARQYSPNHSLDAELTVKFHDCTIKVRSNSPRLVENLGSYFRTFTVDHNPDIEIAAIETSPPEFEYEFTIKKPDPGKTKIKEEFFDLADGRIVRKRLTGMVFVFGKDINLAIGPCLTNSNQVVNFVNNRYIQWRLDRGCLLGHAAGIADGNHGLALAGFSGMGKSTLALHLMNEGFDFVSNDRLMIEKPQGKLIMHGVAKQPRINPGTALNNDELYGIIPEHHRKRFENIPSGRLWEVEQKYDVMIDEIYGQNKFRLWAPLRTLVILNWSRDENEPEFSRVNINRRRDLLGAFIKETGLFYLPPDKGKREFSEETYLDLLSECSVHEISGGINFGKAAEFCRRILTDANVSQE